MALALYGGGITDMRGSVGGNTHSRSKFGATIRAKTSPIQPRGSFQRFSRTQLATVSNRWTQILTDTERSQWNAFALTQPQTNRFGQISYLSGQQWHNKLNVSANIPTSPNYFTTPPATGSYPGLLTLNMNADHAAGGTLVIGYTGTPGTGTPYVIAYVTQCVTAGTYFVSSKLKLIYSAAAADGSHSILTEWKDRYGGYAPLQGQKIFALVKFINNDDGTSSTPLLTSCMVT